MKAAPTDSTINLAVFEEKGVSFNEALAFLSVVAEPRVSGAFGLCTRAFVVVEGEEKIFSLVGDGLDPARLFFVEVKRRGCVGFQIDSRNLIGFHAAKE